MKEMNTFDVSFNEFSGEIPDSISDCSKLEQLYMQNNHFSGFIPPRLSSLKAIQSLDLSRNNLTGKIPMDLEGLTLLKYLNLSFNNLEGEIPVHGVFSNASQAILAGNNKLCGGISELSLPPCLTGRKKKHWKLPIIITMSILGSAITICVIIFSCRRKKDRDITNPNSSNKLSRSEKILRVSYHQLYHATEAFSSKNLVGSGSFGSVYKGKLHQQHGEKLVAVKVLHLDKAGASKSFETECRALRNIRHRNLVPILTYCSSIDLKGNQFKALVYEFMENGNLHEWLHMNRDKITTPTTKNLDILQRLNIAIDVASALQYLHHDCEATIVHCERKPSNILLKSDLTALVGDFGLARLVPKAGDDTYSNQGTTSTTIAIKGSIGYAAPEYGMGAEASTEGDVYSYGILLLEMFTGKRPTDDIFANGLDLHGYVKMNLTKKVVEIADPLLVSYKKEEQEEEEDDDYGDDSVVLKKCLGSVFSIGVKCSAKAPNERICMNAVLGQLQHIKDDFLLVTNK